MAIRCTASRHPSRSTPRPPVENGINPALRKHVGVGLRRAFRTSLSVLSIGTFSLAAEASAPLILMTSRLPENPEPWAPNSSCYSTDTPIGLNGFSGHPDHAMQCHGSAVPHCVDALRTPLHQR